MASNTQIFISYRRDGGDVTAKLICEALKNKGYSVFFDFDALKGGFFDTRILQTIQGCSDVVLVLPVGGLDRCENNDDWVRQEIRHAISCKKNIIPVMLNGFEFPDNLPEDIEVIRRYNGVRFAMDYFDAVIDKIAERLNSVSCNVDYLNSNNKKPTLIFNVCSYCSCDFNNAFPSDGCYSNSINIDTYNVIYFHLSVKKIKKSKLKTGMAIYDIRNNQLVCEELDLDWNPDYDRLSRSWIVKGSNGDFIPTGMYRAEFWIENSQIFRYNFKIVSNRF